MHILEDLNYELEDMIEPVVKKGDISPTELDNIYKAVKTMNYIKTMEAMKEYSNDGSYRGSYAGGGSNRYSRGSFDGRMGMDRDSDGRYSERERRYSYRRGQSRDGYSRDDEKEEIISKLERMMDEAGSEAERQTIRDCMRRIEND